MSTQTREYARALAAWQSGRALTTWQELAPALMGNAERLDAQHLPAAALACAALLRVGDSGQAQALLQRWPSSMQGENVEGAARWLVLQARAKLLAALAAGTGRAQATAYAQQARVQARREGDVGALVAAVTLLGELSLLAEPMSEGRPRGFAALHILAQGLNVTEATGSLPDAHLLSVLAAAQRFKGPAKARATAHKALALSLPGSPARVGALLLLGQHQMAAEQQQLGGLAAGWLRVFDEVAG